MRISGMFRLLANAFLAFSFNFLNVTTGFASGETDCSLGTGEGNGEVVDGIDNDESERSGVSNRRSENKKN